MRKVLQYRTVEVIVIEMHPGELGTLAQGRKEYTELRVLHPAVLHL